MDKQMSSGSFKNYSFTGHKINTYVKTGLGIK